MRSCQLTNAGLSLSFRILFSLYEFEFVLNVFEFNYGNLDILGKIAESIQSIIYVNFSFKVFSQNFMLKSSFRTLFSLLRLFQSRYQPLQHASAGSKEGKH